MSETTKDKMLGAGMIKGAMDWVFNLAPDEIPLSAGRTTAATKIARGYKSIVYACVTLIAKDVANTRFKLFAPNGVAIDDDEAIKRLYRINSLQSWNEFIETTQIFLELTGNAYWYVERTKLGKPTGNVWLIPSQYVTPVQRTDEIGLSHYRVTGLKGVRRFEIDDIVHLKYPNPLDIYTGMGTLNAALVEYDIHVLAKKYALNFYKNGAIPAGILTTDQKLSESDARRIEQRWNEKYQGLHEAWSIAVIWGGFQYQDVSTSPMSDEFIRQSNWSRQDIAAIFKVPLSKLGIVDDVNRANANANDSTYWENCISPKLGVIERAINDQLFPKLGIDLRFEFENVIPEDVETALQKAKIDLQRAQIGGMFGVLSGDEIRQLLGFEPNGTEAVPVPSADELNALSHAIASMKSVIDDVDDGAADE